MKKKNNNKSLLKKNKRNLYSNIVNYSHSTFSKLSKSIDKLPDSNREWLKVKILSKDLNYLAFIDSLTNAGYIKIQQYMKEFVDDKKFKNNFKNKLNNINKNLKEQPDDLRFHSFSLYLIVRALVPKVVIETGVALGKSSSMILLALEHNSYGKLISIDLPNTNNLILKDGSKTFIGNKDTGWLIPDYLKNKWKLFLGDSKNILPKILSVKKNIPNIFIHDSLHTEKHTFFELSLLHDKMLEGLILCDDIDMGSGLAFEKIITKNNKIGYAYKNFAGYRF